jgi:hypothetical protein
MKKIAFFIFVLTAAMVLGQGDPWWRPLSPQGQSYGITYGTTAPASPGQGELWVDMDGSATGGPILNMWDHINDSWTSYTASVGSGTANVLTRWDSAGTALVDSGWTDNGTTMSWTRRIASTWTSDATSSAFGSTRMFTSGLGILDQLSAHSFNINNTGAVHGANTIINNLVLGLTAPSGTTTERALVIQSTYDAEIAILGSAAGVTSLVFTDPVATSPTLTFPAVSGTVALEGQTDRGEIVFSSDAGVAITAGTDIKSTVATTAGELQDFDMPANNRLRYTGTTTENFRCLVTLSGSTSSNPRIVDYEIAKDGVVDTTTIIQRNHGNTDVGAVALHGYFTFATNEYVELWLDVNTDTTVTLTGYTLTCH